MGVAGSFDGLVEPTVFVVGEAFALDAAFPAGTRVIRVMPGDDDPEPTPIALTVLDACTRPMAALARARHSPRLAAVPALVIAHDREAPGLAEIDADDVLSPPFDRLDLAHRLRTLIKLGRTRFALWFAQQALEHSVSGLTIGDRGRPHTPLVHATSVFEKITGYTVAEVRGKDCRFLQGPRTDPVARATLRAAIHDQRRARVTLLNYKKDGAPFWNEVTVFPVRTPDGEPLQWVGGVQHDVTSLVEARAEVDRLVALLLERQRFDQAILNGVDVGIVTTDTGGRVTFVNRCAREILRRETDPEGVDVCDLLELPCDPDSFLASRLEHRGTHTLRASETEIDIDLAVSRAHGTAPADLGFFFIFHDQTRDKQLEMDRNRFERLAAMGTMVAGFAHEVRNPMASLRSIAESLNEELVESNIDLPHVGRMLKVLERVERLVRTSLLFGRPSPPRRAAHRAWTIFSAAVSSLQPRTRHLGGELAIEAPPDLPDVFVDDGQIAQVVVILINNALDATGDPRRVLLRAEHTRGPPDSRAPQRASTSALRSLRSVRRRPRHPPSIIGQLFEPFFTTKPEGTGLGLSIAQPVVTENGGRIEVTSPPNGPTTFSVLVPIANGDEVQFNRH